MRLIGFIIRIYHDTRSPERQNFENFVFPHAKSFFRSCFKMAGHKWILILVVEIAITVTQKYGAPCTCCVCCPRNVSGGGECRHVHITTVKYSFC